MKLISHRGNLTGINQNENRFDTVINACSLGFDVEIDLRFIKNRWWLGHDSPEHLLDSGLDAIIQLKNQLWIHCKNFDALEKLKGTDFNYFWHQDDDHTITSKGFIWTYPGKDRGKTNILVMPEWNYSLEQIASLDCFAVCSDHVQDIQKLMQEMK
jgi:hypothetical protein